jgi:hypothetical protein
VWNFINYCGILRKNNTYWDVSFISELKREEGVVWGV